MRNKSIQRDEIGTLVDCLVEAQKSCDKINNELRRMSARDVLTCTQSFDELLRARTFSMEFMRLVAYELLLRLTPRVGVELTAEEAAIVLRLRKMGVIL